MNKPLSEKYTIDIIKRLEKASGAPWFSSESTYVINNVEGDSWEWDADLIAETKSKEDAQFIAHAREDIPKLLAEIGRMRDLLNKAYQYGITSEAHQNDEDIREIYEYLYGGDSE